MWSTHLCIWCHREYYVTFLFQRCLENYVLHQNSKEYMGWYSVDEKTLNMKQTVVFTQWNARWQLTLHIKPDIIVINCIWSLAPVWQHLLVVQVLCVFQSLPTQVVVIFTQQHMEPCWCLGRERWLTDHKVLVFRVLQSGTRCHWLYVHRPLHSDSFTVD